jgi:aspartate carbamoyltransferase catalytic subunit
MKKTLIAIALMVSGSAIAQTNYKTCMNPCKQRRDSLKKEIVILHPGPINRGVEISSDVADGKNSVILSQVENGVAIRMAAIYLLATGK